MTSEALKATKAEVLEKLGLGLIPDEEAKRLIRDQLERRVQWINTHDCEQRLAHLHNYVQSLRQADLDTTNGFNPDTYEMPIAFMKLIQGRLMKLSTCYFKNKSTTLEDAEEEMLDLYCERAQIRDGDQILDLGSGYGSLAIYVARKYPHCHVTGITESKSQINFAEEQCKNYNLNNVELILGDITKVELNKEFDRVTVIGVFEHIKNYELLLKKISKWMKEDGLLFVEDMCHKNFSYQLKPLYEDDWIEEMIFPDPATIASADLLLYFQKDVSIVNHWVVNGKHISHSSEAWLKRLDDNADAVKLIIKDFLGGSEHEAVKWINYFRLFFLYGVVKGKFNNGEEWMVVHFLFEKK